MGPRSEPLEDWLLRGQPSEREPTWLQWFVPSNIRGLQCLLSTCFWDGQSYFPTFVTFRSSCFQKAQLRKIPRHFALKSKRSPKKGLFSWETSHFFPIFWPKLSKAGVAHHVPERLQQRVARRAADFGLGLDPDVGVLPCRPKTRGLQVSLFRWIQMIQMLSGWWFTMGLLISSW